MAEYALVSSADEVDRIRSDIDPDVATKDGWRWLPVERSTDRSKGSDVIEPPVTTVLADKVTVVSTGRAFTTQELDAQKDAQLTAVQTVVLRVMFNHENRLRTLEGKAAVTLDAFKAALKAML